MINNTIARRYAKALVQLASEAGLVDRFRDELSFMANLFDNDATLYDVFSNPALTLGQKKSIMSDLIAKAEISELTGNFLLLLVDKNRTAFLSQIVHAYRKLADDFSGVVRPVIRTAFPLDDGQVASIQSALEQKTGKKIIPQVMVDQTLLGGVVTQIGDIAYDNSVKTQLKRIQDILQKG